MSAADLAAELARLGHETMYAGLYAAPQDPVCPDDVMVADIAPTGKATTPMLLIRNLRRLTTRFGPDVVQANGSATLKYSVIVKLLYKPSWPLIYRNISVVSQWIRNRWHLELNRLLVNQVNHIASVSEASRADFVRTYRVPHDRISVIRRGVVLEPAPSEARTHLRAECGISVDAPVIIQVGEFGPEKNHVWAVRAFETIASSSSAHFVLVGDGPDRRKAEEEAQRLGLMSRVHFLGARRDARVLMAGADLLVLPSLVEGLPGVVIEAAACGVPAVAAEVGGVPEAIVHGRTGLLYRSNDLDGFVTAVFALLEDSGGRSAMGEAARALAAERFDLRANTRRFEELYRTLLRSNSTQ